MDGDGQYIKDHDQSPFPSRFRMGRRAVPRPSGGATDRFRQAAGALPSARGDATVLSQATGRAQMPSSSYVDYGYTGTSFQQQGAPQLQPYPSSFTQPQSQQQQPSSFNNPYDQEVVYDLPQQGPTHGPYDVPQYPTRQSAAAIQTLSTQFAVPQYFPAGEPTGTTAVADMVSPYLNSQLPPYNQPGPIGRSSATAQPLAANMVDLNNPMGATGYQQQPPPQPQQQQQQPQQQQQVATESTTTTTTTAVDNAHMQLHQALGGAFDHTRAGRLVDASRSLLEISDWLVTNARELDFLRDDAENYKHKLPLWNNFNLCWLSVCQMQKDLTEKLLQTGHQHQLPPHVSLLNTGSLEHMGTELIRLCDQMEQHGLVDYQLGIWEEEILSAITQCLDLMENSPEILHIHPMTATATATSRS